MLFNSLSFLIFFPIVVYLYFVLPHKLKNLWLLVSSYYFYMSWNPKYTLLLAGSTLITYLGGLGISYAGRLAEDKGRIALQKLIVAASFVLNLGILFFFKYFNFVADSVNKLVARIGDEFSITSFDVVLPVGISFYIFQALAYTVDVYRGEIKEERNLLKYALFISFFPQLVAGPIERSKNMIHQIYENIHLNTSVQKVVCYRWHGDFFKNWL